MKYFYILLIAFIFVGCEQPETEEEKLDRETREDNNIIYGGTGTQADPYKIYNGVYGALSDGDFYYSFDLNSSNCSVIFYDEKGYLGTTYPLWKKTSTSNIFLDINSSKYQDYSTYNDLNSSSYLLKVSDVDIANDRFGVYSSCMTKDYTLDTMTDYGYTFTGYQKLYKMTLSNTSTVTFTNYEHLYRVYVFDSNMTIKNSTSSLTSSPLSLNLTAGTYFVLPQGDSTYTTNEVIFNVDIN